MPLLADADVNTGATIVTCVLVAFNGLFTWLGNREKRLSDKDRLDADGEKSKMLFDIAVLKVRVDDCQQDRADQKVEIAHLRAAMERHGIDCPNHRETKTQ